MPSCQKKNNFISPSDPNSAPIEMSFQDAEHAFLLRDFHTALKLSNDILHLETEEKPTMAVPHHQHPISIPNMFSSRYSDSMSPSSNDSSILNCPMMMIHNPFVNMASEKLNLLDRAAAVAIQSSYEIWKGHSLESSKDLNKMAKDGDKRNALEKKCDLMRNLQPFLDAYSHHESPIQGEGSYSRIMSLDLASIWIRFQHAVGFVGHSTLASLELLLNLLIVAGEGSPQGAGWSRENEEKEEYLCESLYECAYDILHLLLLQTLPFMEDIRMVETITDELFMVLMEPKNKKGNTRSFQALHLKIFSNPIKMSSHPIRQSLNTMHRCMEAIMESRPELVPNFLTDAVEECLEEGKELRIQLNPLTENGKKSFCPEERSMLNDETERNNLNDTFHEGRPNFSKADIIHALWDSDDRWSNRGIVLAAGILTYTTWKKRHRVLKSSRKIGSSIMSPLNEIASAVALFKKS